nr:MAG TPA: hypothetical protein [Bacteriophage sp.]
METSKICLVRQGRKFDKNLGLLVVCDEVLWKYKC